MHSKFKLFGTPSSRTRRCLWTLEEVGADYEFEKIDFAKGDHQTPAFLKLNPNARVPVMSDLAQDLVLFESAAICLYVARRFPDAMLLPESGSRLEALHDQWMYWIVAELEQALWSMGKHRFALPAQYRVAEMMKTALFEWQRATPVLAGALGDSPFLLGDSMHLVDIMLAHTLLWARGFKVAFEHDNMESYLDRMIARPAFTASKRFD